MKRRRPATGRSRRSSPSSRSTRTPWRRGTPTAGSEVRRADILVCLGLCLNPTWGGDSCLPKQQADKNVCPTPDVGRTFLTASGFFCLNPTWGGHSCLPKQQADKNVRPTPDVGRTFLSALGFVSTRRGADIPVCRSSRQTRMSAPHPTWGGHSCLPWALSQPDVGRTFLSAEAAGRQECPPHTRRGADILVCLGLCLNPTWGGHSCLPKQKADRNVCPTKSGWEMAWRGATGGCRLTSPLPFLPANCHACRTPTRTPHRRRGPPRGHRPQGRREGHADDPVRVRRAEGTPQGRRTRVRRRSISPALGLRRPVQQRRQLLLRGNGLAGET